MRFRWRIEDALSNRAAVRVLRVLTLTPSVEFSGREIARMSGVGSTSALRELRRLEDQGLVASRSSGGATLWRAWTDHVLFEPLQRAFRAEMGAADAFIATAVRGLRQSPGLREVWLFGSQARGDDRPDSDVDVLLVVGRDAQREKAWETAAGVSLDLRSSFKLTLSPIVYSQREFRAKRRLPLVKNILSEGRRLWSAAP